MCKQNQQSKSNDYFLCEQPNEDNVNNVKELCNINNTMRYNNQRDSDSSSSFFVIICGDTKKNHPIKLVLNIENIN